MASNTDDTRNFIRFKEALKAAFGSTIRKPITVGLGYKDENGNIYLRVPESVSDLRRRYYFHDLTGEGYVGEAYLAEGTVGREFIRYNMPVRIKRDEVNDDWVIVGIDARLAAEYLGDITPSRSELIDTNQIKSGLLYPTTPPSMQAMVLGSAYTYNDTWKYFDTQLTADFSEEPLSSYIPTANNRARYVLVQINATTGELSYKPGEEDFPATLTHKTVAKLNNDGGLYMPQTDDGYFRVGYLKLISGMTAFQAETHLFPLQELIVKGVNSASPAAAEVLSYIVVTHSGEVVVANRGEVVWSVER